MGAGILAALVGGAAYVGTRYERAAEPRALLDRYCVGCHNDAERAGEMSLERVSTDAVPAHPDVWEAVVRKVRTGFMPPSGEPRPAAAVLDLFATGIERRLDQAAASAPRPGSRGIARLNRAEYANAIRDLLAYDARAIVDALPTDDSIQGFDNIAAALTVSPTLIESYVNAAVKISRAAVGDRSLGPSQVTYEVPAGLSHAAHIDGLPLGTRGGFRFTHNFPLDGNYELRVRTRGPGALSGQRFCPSPKIDVTLDGRGLAFENAETLRLPVGAGPRTLTVALLDERRCEGVNELYGVYAPAGAIQSVEIHGPFEPTGTGDTPSRRTIFGCRPASTEEEAPCARQILTRLATRAYRHPLGIEEPAIDTLMTFYEQGRLGGDFETGVQRAIARMLVDPRFLYRSEPVPPGVAAGEVYRLGGIELASRLSFFLWSSVPDDELQAAATANALHEPAVLEQQVRRMLADPRSAALVENFAGQWLKLRELGAALPQDAEFDANLRDAFRRETELLVDSVIREDRSMLDLLDAPYTFLNERLAKHYGIPNVRGSYMRRVAVGESSQRRGLLGHGSLLTVTSAANRTSPVVRGQWLVENLLGATVPPPPPGVEVDLSNESSPPDAKTLRQRMERHRRDPVCASCHGLIDPFGLALENFDLVGRWRDVEAGEPIDAAAVLVDGTLVNGPAELRRALLARSDVFVTAITEKLMTYALGRILEPHDLPAVRRIVAAAAAEDYRFSALVLGVARSVPFQMQVAAEDAEKQQ
jgi:hypothetical protein